MGDIEPTTWSLLRPLRFTAGEFFALSPVIVIAARDAVVPAPLHPPQRYLWQRPAIGIAFFIFKSVSAKVQPNWPAPAYIGLFIRFAGHAARLAGERRRWPEIGMISSLLLLAIAYFPSSIGVPGNRDPFKDAKLWHGPIRQLSREAAVFHPEFIVTDNYRLSSELAFYWPRSLPAYVIGRSDRRFNQFDMWPGINHEVGRTGLYVGSTAATPPQFERAFAACTALTPVAARAADGTVLRTLYGYICTDYRPIQWPEPTSF